MPGDIFAQNWLQKQFLSM